MGTRLKKFIKVIIFLLIIAFISSQASALKAHARFSPVQGPAPLTVMFYDYSEGTPSQWTWDFGDGFTGEGPQVMYTYMNPGEYSVQLMVTDQNGITDIAVYERSIQVYPNPFMPSFPVAIPPFNADFSAAPQSGPSPLAVQFTDLSKGEPTVWEWTFGDGTISREKNPVHVYTTPGTYSVVLKTSRENSTGMKERRNYIKVSQGTGQTSLPEAIDNQIDHEPGLEIIETATIQEPEIIPDLPSEDEKVSVCVSELTLSGDLKDIIPGQEFGVKITGTPFDKVYLWISHEPIDESGITPEAGSVVEGGLSEEAQSSIYYMILDRNVTPGISPYIVDEAFLFDTPGMTTIGDYIPDSNAGDSIYELIPDTTSDISNRYYGTVALDKNGEHMILLTSKKEAFGLYSINVLSEKNSGEGGCIESIMLSLYPLS